MKNWNHEAHQCMWVDDQTSLDQIDMFYLGYLWVGSTDYMRSGVFVQLVDFLSCYRSVAFLDLDNF